MKALVLLFHSGYCAPCWVYYGDRQRASSPHSPSLSSSLLTGKSPQSEKKTGMDSDFYYRTLRRIPAAQNSSAALHTHRTSVQMAHGRRQGVGVPLSDPLLSSCASRHSHPKEVLSAWTATKAFRPRQSPVRRPVLKTVRARNTAHVCTHRANTVCTRLFGKCRNLLACCCRGLKALRA